MRLVRPRPSGAQHLAPCPGHADRRRCPPRRTRRAARPPAAGPDRRVASTAARPASAASPSAPASGHQVLAAHRHGGSRQRPRRWGQYPRPALPDRQKHGRGPGRPSSSTSAYSRRADAAGRTRHRVTQHLLIPSPGQPAHPVSSPTRSARPPGQRATASSTAASKQVRSPVWQAPPAWSTLTSTASPSQSSATDFTCCRWPEVSPFHPVLLPAARPVGAPAGGQRAVQRLIVHPAEHEHLTGVVLLGDGGDQPVRRRA